ncbi:hypothetical protein DE146DRAFT_611918, partial [Phaeosphaeria sp. MPI-PUGE-AT-0046c]
GASKFQLSRPSIIDLIAFTASLMILEKGSIQTIVEKSIEVTGHLETLLDHLTNKAQRHNHRGKYSPRVIQVPEARCCLSTGLSPRFLNGL